MTIGDNMLVHLQGGQPHPLAAALSLLDRIVDSEQRHQVDQLNYLAGSILFDRFQEFFERFDECEALGLWDKWVKAQASLVWRHRGAPVWQPKAGELDDYMHAKRFLAYLVADSILSQLCNTERCPVDLLTLARVKYLLSLSVEEFARIRAYLSSLERCRRESSDRGVIGADERRDYYVALQAVYDYLRALLSRKCAAERRAYCKSNFLQARCGGSTSNGSAQLSEIDLHQIKSAKRNAIERLRLGSDVYNLAQAFVDSFYNEFGATGGTTARRGSEQVADVFFKHSAVANMFEFFVLCLIEPHTA